MSTPVAEATLVRRIRDLLTGLGAKVIKTSGQAEPDLVGSYKGYAFAIEVKTGNNKPGSAQRLRLKEWERAGAIAFWTNQPAMAVITLEDEINARLTALLQEAQKVAGQS